MKKIISSCLLLAMITIPAAAGPLRAQWVSADARWVAHLDLEAARASALGSFIIDNQERFDIEFGELEEMGINPLEDIDNITIYGVGNPEDEGIIIVRTNDKIDRLIEMAREKAPNFKEIDIDGLTIYSFDKGDMYAYVRKSRNGDTRTIIITKAQDRLIRAINVIRGRVPSLDEADNTDLILPSRDGVIVCAAAAGLPWMEEEENNPASQILKMAQSLSIQLGEDGPESYVNVSIETSSKEDAQNIYGVLNGVLSLGRMMSGQPDSELAELRTLIDNVKLDSNKKSLSITISCPTQELLEIIEKLEERNHSENEDDDDEDDDDWDN